MAIEFKDYYKTLGVSRTASADEIKKAFRTLARKHHPDIASNKSEGEQKFKEINEAYEVLKDPEKRKRYDQMGQNWNEPGAQQNWRTWGSDATGWQSAARRGTYRTATNGPEGDFHFEGTGFSDFFERFFGRGWDNTGSTSAGQKGHTSFEDLFGSGQRPGGQGRTRASGFSHHQQKGEDLESEIMVTLEEALNGSTRRINLKKENPQTGATESQSFQVRIPAGVREGQRIRLAGKGQTAGISGINGDLYLRVKYAAHPDFQIQGSNLTYSLELAPWEAVLGASVAIPTLEGIVTVKIRPGTQGGQKLRLKGKGLPGKEGARGDLFAEISIAVPHNPTAEERKLWEQLARTSHFSPRD